MAYIKMSRFSGVAPRVSPRLLNDTYAQVAEDVDVRSGRLEPLKTDSTVTSLVNSIRKSIYLYEGQHWLEWNEDYVKAVPGPVPGDTNARLYWTGEGTTQPTSFPRMGVLSGILAVGVDGYPEASYRLGVPAPEAAPAVVLSGTADETQIPDDVAYIYTLVTAFGEEGPPSLASTVLEKTDPESVTITMSNVDVPTGNYNFGAGALKRIYRSNVGSNTSEYQFLAEVAITTEVYVDNVSSSQLGEVIPSLSWIGPPNDDVALYPDGPMQGLTALANGIFAGFTGKRLCLSEPYLPHAWPIDYRITLEESIVAIGGTSNGVLCLTDGKPYFVTGTDPSSMVAVQLDFAQACINKHSVVDMGEYLMYASPDGLCIAASSGSQVVTLPLITPEQWVDSTGAFRPDKIKAFRHEGAYVAFWEDGGSFGGWVFDPTSEDATLTTLDISAAVQGGFTNPKDGELYLVVGSNVVKHRGSPSTVKPLTWRSKKFFLPKPVSLTWLSVSAEAYPVSLKVWGDGVLVADYTLDFVGPHYTHTVTVPAGASVGTLREPVMRMPSKIAQEWQVEVTSQTAINEVCLAQSIEEVQDT